MQQHKKGVKTMLSNEYKKIVTDEIYFAANKMESSKDPADKLYYFSAIFGVLHRILNIDYNPDLLFAHFVLRSTHDSFLNRLKAIKQGGDNSVRLSEEQFDKLVLYSIELADNISNNISTDSALKKFVILLYSTTGNGFYLMQKGRLTI
jgi:hypothetical protein